MTAAKLPPHVARTPTAPPPVHVRGQLALFPDTAARQSGPPAERSLADQLALIGRAEQIFGATDATP